MTRPRPRSRPIAHSPKPATASEEGLACLTELALDMHWSWNHGGDQLWQKLDPDLWERTRNPWVVLQTVSRDRLEGLLGDPAFRKMVDTRLQDRGGRQRLGPGFSSHIPTVRSPSISGDEGDDPGQLPVAPRRETNGEGLVRAACEPFHGSHHPSPLRGLGPAGGFVDPVAAMTTPGVNGSIR